MRSKIRMKACLRAELDEELLRKSQSYTPNKPPYKDYKYLFKEGTGLQ